MINKQDFFKLTNEIIKENIEEIKKTKNNFIFNIGKITEEIDETKEEMKRIEEKLFSITKYQKLGNYEIKMIKMNNPELEQVVKQYSSLKTKLGRLEGIKEILEGIDNWWENNDDYNVYYLNKNNKAYVKGFQLPSSSPENVLDIFYKEEVFLKGEVPIRDLDWEGVGECYIVEQEEDRQRIKKIIYMEEVLNKYFFEDGVEIRTGIQYLFLGDKTYIYRNRLKYDKNYNLMEILEEIIEEKKEELNTYEWLKEEKYMNKLKETILYLLILEDTIQKILNKYENIYVKIYEASVLDIPF